MIIYKFLSNNLQATRVTNFNKYLPFGIFLSIGCFGFLLVEVPTEVFLGKILNFGS